MCICTGTLNERAKHKHLVSSAVVFPEAGLSAGAGAGAQVRGHGGNGGKSLDQAARTLRSKNYH